MKTKSRTEPKFVSMLEKYILSDVHIIGRASDSLLSYELKVVRKSIFEASWAATEADTAK